MMNPRNENSPVQENISVDTTPGLNETLQAAQAIDTSQALVGSQPSATPLTDRPVSTGESHSMLNSVANVIKDYPGPSLLFGAGLTWLLVSREQNRNRSLPVRIRDRALETKDHLLEAKDHTLERLSDAKQYTSEHASQAAQQAAQRYENAKISAEHGAEVVRSAYQNTLQENPLVLGACAVAAGLALGLLLPQTHKENELMGETRDGLMDQARGIVDEARKAAVRTLHIGSESVKEHLVEAAQEAKQTVIHSMEDAQEAATEEAKSQASQPRNESKSTTPHPLPPTP